MVQIIVDTVKKPVQQSTVSQPVSKPPFVKKPDGSVVVVSPVVRKITPPEERPQPTPPPSDEPKRVLTYPQPSPPGPQTVSDFVVQSHKDLIDTRSALHHISQEHTQEVRSQLKDIQDANRQYQETIDMLKSHPASSLWTFKDASPLRYYTTTEMIDYYTRAKSSLQLDAVNVGKTAFSNLMSISKAKTDVWRAERELFSFSRSIPYPSISTVDVKDGQVTVHTKQSDVVKHIYGGDRPDLYIAKHAQDFGLPLMFAAAERVSPFYAFSKVYDKSYVDPFTRLHEQYASEIVEGTQKPKESSGAYLQRRLLSFDALANIYLPIATVGVGYAAKPFLVGVKTIPATSKLFTASRVLSHYQKPITIAALGAVSAPVVFSMSTQPDASPLILGRTLAAFGKMGAGYALGGRLYSFSHKKLLQDMHWTGTEYEHGIIQMHHQQSVLASQYRPFEFGHPSTHLSMTLKPVSAKIPYVPKTPQVIHTVTRGFSDSLGDPYHTFILRRPLVSARTFSYEVAHPAVDPGVSITHGKLMTKQGFERQITGVSVDKPLFDFQDIALYRTSGRILSSGRDVFSRGTLVTKTMYPSSGTPGKYGFSTVKQPIDITYSFSRSTSPFYDVFNLGKQYKNIPVFKETFGGGSMGFDTRGLTDLKTADTLFLPGGGFSSQSGQSMFSSMTKLGGFPKMSLSSRMSLSHLEWLEQGLQASSRWSGAIPSVIQKTLQRTMQRTTPIQTSVIKQFTTPIGLTSFATLQHQQGLSLSALREIQLTRQKQHQLQMQGVTALPIFQYPQVTISRHIPAFAPVSPTVLPEIRRYTPITIRIKPPPPPPPPPPPVVDLDGSVKKSGGLRTKKVKKGKRTLWELPIPGLKSLFGG